MTPEELDRLKALMERLRAKWEADDERAAQMIRDEQSQVVKDRTTMEDIHECLQKLLAHERLKLKDLDESLGGSNR